MICVIVMGDLCYYRSCVVHDTDATVDVIGVVDVVHVVHVVHVLDVVDVVCVAAVVDVIEGVYSERGEIIMIERGKERERERVIEHGCTYVSGLCVICDGGL